MTAKVRNALPVFNTRPFCLLQSTRCEHISPHRKNKPLETFTSIRILPLWLNITTSGRQAKSLINTRSMWGRRSYIQHSRRVSRELWFIYRANDLPPCRLYALYRVYGKELLVGTVYWIFYIG